MFIRKKKKTQEKTTKPKQSVTGSNLRSAEHEDIADVTEPLCCNHT